MLALWHFYGLKDEESLPGANPLNCLKSGTITLANTFPRNKFAGRNESAFTPVLYALVYGITKV